MNDRPPIVHRFGAVAPCTILPGRQRRIEHLLLTSAFNAASEAHIGAMVRQGYDKVYHGFSRDACESCHACKPARIDVNAHQPSASQRKILKANADTDLQYYCTYDQPEHHALFMRHQKRMDQELLSKEVDPAIIIALIDSMHYRSSVIEARLDGALVGVVIFNMLDDGIAGNHIYYDPDLARDRSLGTFMILQTIQHVKDMKLPYLYMGAWNEEAKGFSYKSRFRPMETLRADGEWRPEI